MAILIQKPKKAEKQKLEKVEVIDPNTLTDEELADEYGKLEDQMNAAMQNPVFAQFKLAKEALQKRLDENFQPTDELEITGKHWLLEIGVAAKESASIGDLALVRKYMGDQAFMACAKVTLTDAKAYLTPEQLEKVMQPGQGYTNRRKIKASYLG